MRHATRWIVAGAAAAALASCTKTRGPSDEEAPPAVKDPSLVLDQIGLYFSVDSEDERAKKAVKELGLKQVHRHGQSLSSFALARPKKPEEIRALAAKLEQQFPRLILQAGVLEVLVPGAGKRPPVVRLLTDQVVARFPKNVSHERVNEVLREAGVRPLMESRHAKGRWLGTVGDEGDVRFVGERLKSMGASYAHPNYVLPVEDREVIPTDPEFFEQWHLQNSGADGGRVDADVDASRAWDFSAGAVRWPRVAIIEGKGFELTHPDYVEGIVGSAVIRECTDSLDGCEPGYPNRPWHGTAAAGLVGARANGFGVVGVCPECSLILIEASDTTWGKAEGIEEAVAQGALYTTPEHPWPTQQKTERGLFGLTT